MGSLGAPQPPSSKPSKANIFPGTRSLATCPRRNLCVLMRRTTLLLRKFASSHPMPGFCHKHISECSCKASSRAMDANLALHGIPTPLPLIPMVYRLGKPWSCTSTPKTPFLSLRMHLTPHLMPCEQAKGHVAHVPPKGDDTMPLAT